MRFFRRKKAFLFLDDLASDVGPGDCIDDDNEDRELPLDSDRPKNFPRLLLDRTRSPPKDIILDLEDQEAASRCSGFKARMVLSSDLSRFRGAEERDRIIGGLDGLTSVFLRAIADACFRSAPAIPVLVFCFR
mmetsp:Transcript_32539/g.48253  ORF Transcript_32539/g.48253 Transcript_32539/m.48253 type:complete len:133 (+) Transcript_32539:107-505(+)